MFNTRYKEAIRNNHSNTGYSNHILNTGHKYGTIVDTVDVIRTGKKGKHLNTSEKCHIYLTKKDNLQMNKIHVTLTIQYLRPYMNNTIDSTTYHSLIIYKQT
jgi:hypothetical protein